jgi:uncharacterized protein
MTLFTDTSAFYALLDRDDRNHQKGKKAWMNILGDSSRVVTSNYIFLETFALLQSRLGLEAVRGFQEDVVPIVQVEFVTPEIHRAGLAALLSAGRRGLSLVDCVSFELMRDLGIKMAFTFDSHFKEHGFTAVPWRENARLKYKKISTKAFDLRIAIFEHFHPIGKASFI